MAECVLSSRPEFFPSNLYEAVSKSKILVVGAGGIGCELIKNLVLSGFRDIDIVGSNLPRIVMFISLPRKALRLNLSDRSCHFDLCLFIYVEGGP